MRHARVTDTFGIVPPPERRESMVVSSPLGGALEATPRAERDCDHTPLMGVCAEEGPPSRSSPEERPVAGKSLTDTFLVRKAEGVQEVKMEGLGQEENHR